MFQQYTFAQAETFTIKKAPFSSDKYDEFSPVFYYNGIVFCSNRNRKMVINYSTSQNKGLFKINYIDTTGKISWKKARLLSRTLKTRLNDGPATFNTDGDTIYFSRNINVEGKIKELAGRRNNLGIFSAVWTNGRWRKVREFRFNNEWNNITTPCLSPDGRRLYFASDKPGGYGGSDLYYSQWKKDYWDNPVNLGPVINTKGNEAYPFINQAGELFFSSDGHPGLGGKDIFFSGYADTAWFPPVPLDPPINSQFDDFGIVADSTMSEGYFSSKRGKTFDIYSFKTRFPQIFYFENQKTDQYCYKFNDDGAVKSDSINFHYEWDFGDGTKATGVNVEHCFTGPGNYSVKQNIIEKNTKRIFFTKLSYDLIINDIEQAYITCPDAVVTGESVNLDALKSNLPGYEILAYSWDFGDGEKAIGSIVSHAWKGNGEFVVKLGVTIKHERTGIIYKKGISRRITICKDAREMASFKTSMNSKKAVLWEVMSNDQVIVKTRYSAAEDLLKGAVFQVEIISSKNKADINSNSFKNILTKSYVKEIWQPDIKLYSYIIDEETNLMNTWLIYKDAVSMGFRDARIKTYLPKDPAEKELLNLKKVFGVSADDFFIRNDLKASLGAYPLLDQITGLLNKYPAIKLEIAVHTDNIGSPVTNLQLSQARAVSLVNYLIGRGISSKRLIPKGFGEAKPIVTNFFEAERRKNRRVEFIIINE